MTKVTFIVPCYRLAHLLPECVNSILAQTYKDFEVLIMDDCSPDDTPEVARSFNDPRVKHVRNEPNLGHLANYNKGIELSQGDYIWLISADDRLRVPYVLERYVEILDHNANVGFVFCPAIGLQNERETGQVAWTANGGRDALWKGRAFAKRLIHGNSVAAPAALVRSSCYRDVTLFPLDLPYAGDWYLWCMFSFYHDVAYLAEPMVNYRLHELSMTNRLTQQHRVLDNLAVRWKMKVLADKDGDRALSAACLESIARHYAYCLASRKFTSDGYGLEFGDFEVSLRAHALSDGEQRIVRSRTNARFADACYAAGDMGCAQEAYLNALRLDPWMPKLWVKIISLKCGRAGKMLRNFWAIFREALSI